MNRKLWDLYAPIYKRAMKANQHIYEFMKQNGWHVTFSKEMSARIAMVYAECIRDRKEKTCQKKHHSFKRG